jgi:hypothetical protein
LFQPDIKTLIDLSLVFSSEDGKSPHFGGVPDMGSATGLGVKSLYLDDADLAPRNRWFCLERPEQIVALSEFLLRYVVTY